jgi:pyruvate ferredoxin oxidoreductase beta subunit
LNQDIIKFMKEKPLTLRSLTEREEFFSPGHRACAGCAEPIAVRQILLAAKNPVVVGASTGCLEVTTTIFPYTAWKASFIHSAFENVAATIAGVEAGYNALRKRGKVSADIDFIAFGGDGGTYDIGLQALSGALERGHRMLYVCIDNQAYMNTGIQRSSATPKGAHTTTAPAGKQIPGKPQFRKDLTKIAIAHNIPYVAQAVVGNWRDLMKKVEYALSCNGPSLINILSPCPLGWGFSPDATIEIGQLAVDTCFWPLYEVRDGVYKITHKPKEKKPLSEWLKLQRRFKHLFSGKNRHIIEELQVRVDKCWEELCAKEKAKWTTH